MRRKLKKHTLKTNKPFFDDIITRKKTFDIRRHDRDFKVGDILLLKEWNQYTESFTGQQFSVTIIYILLGGQFGIEEGYVILGIK